jgi:hypothetical protein
MAGDEDAQRIWAAVVARDGEDVVETAAAAPVPSGSKRQSQVEDKMAGAGL